LVLVTCRQASLVPRRAIAYCLCRARLYNVGLTCRGTGRGDGPREAPVPETCCTRSSGTFAAPQVQGAC
jgi:hypothetical protein